MISSPDPSSIQNREIQATSPAKEVSKPGILKKHILGKKYIGIVEGNLKSVDNPAVASNIKDVHAFVTNNPQLLSFEQVKMLKAAITFSSALPPLVQAIANLINAVVSFIFGKTDQTMRQEIHHMAAQRDVQIQTEINPIKKELREKIIAKIKDNDLLGVYENLVFLKGEIKKDESRLNSSIIPNRSARVKLAEQIRGKQTSIEELLDQGENRANLKKSLEDLRESEIDSEILKLAKRQLLNESFKELMEELSDTSHSLTFSETTHVQVILGSSTDGKLPR